VPTQPVERKLAAIFAADIAGYSRLMARDEVGTLAHLKVCRGIIDGLIGSHRGRIFNTAGDSVVADFASAVDAVQCGVAVQAAIAKESAGSNADEPMQYRIEVHMGDVMVDGDNLLGDGVGPAALSALLAADSSCSRRPIEVDPSIPSGPLISGASPAGRRQAAARAYRATAIARRRPGPAHRTCARSPHHVRGANPDSCPPGEGQR
jgi:adenylate cyclase